ncbi:MAG: NAD(P)H-dependent oxidoreductase [Oscillospiraceae bacterium]|nr:NAD(P)H-dependent oxidoreductase [Oscillospiraceae bacterium]
MVLFVNACVRGDSRTKRLADCLLSEIGRPVVELRLEEQRFPAVNEEFLRERDRLCAEGMFEAPVFEMARQFALADEIVIAAPYWDLSFPAALKQYLEQINVVGVTFRYTPEGIPEGLCRAKKLYYVMTAGGLYCPEEYGYGYVKALAQSFYGIPETELIRAVGLDLDGADAEEILRQAIDAMRSGEQ